MITMSANAHMRVDLVKLNYYLGLIYLGIIKGH